MIASDPVDTLLIYVCSYSRHAFPDSDESDEDMDQVENISEGEDIEPDQDDEDVLEDVDFGMPCFPYYLFKKYLAWYVFLSFRCG